MTGPGLSTEKETDDELPPPGEALLATKFKEPTGPRSAEASVTVNCVLLTNVTECDAPPTLNVVVGTKPVPVTLTVTGPALRAAEEGFSEVIAGGGLVTVIVLVEDSGPLDTEPFITVITSCPPEEANAAEIWACSCVALT
jgi:hypothetical protein